MLIEKSIERVQKFADARGLSPAALAELAGLSPGTLRNFRRQSWSPTANTLRKIEATIPQDFACAGESKGAAE